MRRSIPRSMCQTGSTSEFTRRKHAKKGNKLDKFEARSVDGIFFGYTSHSRAFRVLNLETKSWRLAR
jgi:hypothetical protein